MKLRMTRRPFRIACRQLIDACRQLRMTCCHLRIARRRLRDGLIALTKFRSKFGYVFFGLMIREVQQPSSEQVKAHFKKLP